MRVDNDPMVMAHVRALPTGMPVGCSRYLEEDLSGPDPWDTLDLAEPVGLMLVAIGHFLPRPGGRATVLGALPSGS